MDVKIKSDKSDFWKEQRKPASASAQVQHWLLIKWGDAFQRGAEVLICILEADQFVIAAALAPVDLNIMVIGVQQFLLSFHHQKKAGFPCIYCLSLEAPPWRGFCVVRLS